MSLIGKHWKKVHREALQSLLPYLQDLRSSKNIDDASFRDAMTIGVEFIFGTVTNVGNKIGSNTATINKWLDGKTSPPPAIKIRALDSMIHEIVKLQTPEKTLLKEFRKAVNQAIKDKEISPEKFTEIFDHATTHLYRTKGEALEKLDISGVVYSNWSQHKSMPHGNTREKIVMKISQDIGDRLKELKL